MLFFCLFGFGCFGQAEISLPIRMAYEKECHDVLHASDSTRIKIQVANNPVLKKVNMVVTVLS